MILQPLPGRDFKSKAAVLEAFNSGKDFIINELRNKWDGRPANKQNLIDVGVGAVQFRYSNNRKTFMEYL